MELKVLAELLMYIWMGRRIKSSNRWRELGGDEYVSIYKVYRRLESILRCGEAMGAAAK